ncbi:MAG: SRPBCC family protein [Bacteroidia bacterium]|nr:SRPBCC family protein [Bacteroidia bacterium]
MRLSIIVFSISILLSGFAYGQSMDKKYKSFEVSRDLPIAAEKVWEAVALDYGKIAESHPKIWYSGYEAGSLKGGLNAQRRCDFNKSGSRVLHEQIVDWDPENMLFVNRVLEAGGFPIDPDNTRATYKVTDLGEGKSRISMKMEFRSKPSFMMGMLKSQFQKLLADYFIALEHHLTTGEVVNAKEGNYKEIKKKYSK